MPGTPKKTKSRKILTLESGLKENPYKSFNIAFCLIGAIPFLVFFYLLTVELFGLNIFIGRVGFILSMAIVISLLGYYIGYRIISNTLDKVLHYAKQARESNELKTSFLAEVSHELRNPLTVLRTNLFNIREGIAGPVTEEQKSCLDICYETIGRISRLVNVMLDLYRIEAGMAGVNLREQNLKDMVGVLFKEFRTIAERKGIRLVESSGGEDAVILCDADKIMEVMSNFLNNAIKYTPENGTVTFRIRRVSGGAVIECEDNGEGIPEGDIERIFDKFVRVNPKKESAGLGLTIAKNIVELHGGKIWAESRKGKGSMFAAFLPRGAKRPTEAYTARPNRDCTEKKNG